MPLAELRRAYPELASARLAPVDIVDDGERLDSIPGESLDFIVANHFLEHAENPIGAIERHLRRLRPGGVLFLAVPDKRFTLDAKRPVTELEHLLRDYNDAPQWSRPDHYLEWAKLVVRAPDPKAEAKRLAAEGYRIHFHVWTREDFRAMLAYLRGPLRFPFAVEALEPNHHEFIAVLRKKAATAR